MTTEDALAIIDQVLPYEPLTNLQEIIFCQVWQDKTYAEIAETYSYEHSYIRDVGFKLWQRLSLALGQKVSKSNVRAVLSRYARLSHTPATSETATSGSAISEPTESTNKLQLDCPNGPVPLHSSFYIERHPLEARCYNEILKPGSLLRIKAPCQTGKTSLLHRLLEYGRSQQMQTVKLNLSKADRDIFQSLDHFLQWFCVNIAHQLAVDVPLEPYWNPIMGSKVSCTAFLEACLEMADRPMLIAIDELHQVFEYPAIASDLLPLLRSWYEDAKEVAIWSHVRWVITHTTDVNVPLKLYQSPFNVGLSIKLPAFTIEQVHQLAQCHGLVGISETSLASLVDMVSGRPGMIRLALYHLAQGTMSLNQLLQDAPTQAGIYDNHLRQLLGNLQADPALLTALHHVVTAEQPVKLEPIIAYRLESIGVITLQRNHATPSCQLYQQYFQEQLALSIA